MSKKPERKQKDTQFNFRCRREELNEFRRAADREGFDGLASWILWHLRRIVRDSGDKDR